MTMSRTRTVLTVALALVAASAAPAAAEPLERSTATFSVTEPEDNFPCVEQGFSTLATFTVTRRSTIYGDAAGEPVREIRAVRFTGILYSPDLSRSLPYAGRFTRTEDYRTGIITITGLFRYTPGAGPDPSASGRTVIDLAADAAVFESGRLPADYEREVCRILAG